jgi:membrane-associated phospholipid phosphatase
MEKILLLFADYYSVVPLSIYLCLTYLAFTTPNNFIEFISLTIFMIVNDNITKIIKRQNYPESLYKITRRPEGAFNTDMLSRNGKAKPTAPGFPSGHMTTISFLVFYMILRKWNFKGSFINYLSSNIVFNVFNIILILIMAWVRYYKKCHNITQIIGGFIYGSITGSLYYYIVGRNLRNINLLT